MSPRAFPPRPHLWLRPGVGLVLACIWLLSLPGVAGAAITVNNSMEGTVASATTGPELFGYHQGSQESFDLDADFLTGTFDDVEVDPSGTLLQLAGPTSESWWDVSWGARRCFVIDNPNADVLDDHQVRLVFDSSAELSAGLITDGADYRAIAEDDTTLLDHWLEAGAGTTETIVWVQLDLAAATTTRLCLYFDNDTAASVSSQEAVFTYDAPQQLYFPASYRFDGGAGTTGTISLVSFTSGNQVSVDGVPATLNVGQTATFTNITPDSVILSTGPLAGRGLGNGMDSIVPASFAGTEMIFPTNRGNQRWSLISPTGDVANVEIYNGTALAWSGTVGGAVVSPSVDVGGNRSGVIRTTNGVPIIVTHTSTQLYDSVAVPPFFGDDIYGVRSRYTYVGVADGPANVDIWRSDGTIQNIVGMAGGSVTRIYDGADLDGNGTAVRFTNMTHPTGGLQQADRNGLESTSYLPERLLESEYFLPTSADYIAFSCPTSTTIMVGAVPVACTAPSPGFPGHGHIADTPAGTHIRSDNGAPFFAYYEDDATQDETNLFGMKSAQAFSELPVTSSNEPLELLPVGASVGSWTSPLIDTATTGTNVFGLLTLLGDAPAGTTTSVQAARGATPALALAAPFVGPDGTATTSFSLGETPAPFGWDFGDAYVVLRVVLTTDTPGISPTVDLVSLGYDLPELGQTSTHVIDTGLFPAETDWVVRVWTEDPALLGGEATAIYLDSSGLPATGDMTLAVDTEAQIQIVGAAVNQLTGTPVAIGSALAHNVSVDSNNMTGAEVAAVWQARLAGSGILVHHQLELVFS